MTKIGVLDYGSGNLGSVRRALAALGVEHVVVNTAVEAAKLDKIIFPGVGAAGQAMQALRGAGLDAAIKSHAQQGKPLLGICVGMQVLGLRSEEDSTECLGLLPYSLERFQVDAPVPHMGWNELRWNAGNPAASKMALGLPTDASVYYVHSYCIALHSDAEPAFVAASSEYANQRFVGAVAHGNIWGTQFHTEKSGGTGLTIIKNFVEL